LSYDFWRRSFGADSSVVGRTVRLDAFPITIIGVLMPGMTLALRDMPSPDIWIPLQLGEQSSFAGDHSFIAVASLRPGTTVETAQQDLSQLTSRFPVLMRAGSSHSFMR